MPDTRPEPEVFTNTRTRYTRKLKIPTCLALIIGNSDRSHSGSLVSDPEYHSIMQSVSLPRQSPHYKTLYIVKSSTYCDVVDGMWYAVAHRSNCSYYPDTVTPCSLGNNTRCHRCNNKFEANPVVSLTGDASKWVTNTISYNIRKHFLNF